MDPDECRHRLAAATLARLGTVTADGWPHLVPVTFALVGDVAYSAVDAKPKRTTRLRRLDNVRATGRACLLTDHYDDDWAKLWWVRADADATVLDDRDAQTTAAIRALVDKYPQYAASPPTGPVLALHIRRWVGWAATPS